ncbi:Mobile element protein [Candidatus Enterovibrio escicola]|uniref:Mobile element protein n=1 Tax=Candidatus Enterovibrio escicola TaxID=1927127 RepID=A0A2A5T7Y7_9GAMM|nr:Mobile element protein [Candidatus Enterovibrio escacola]
MSMTSARLSFLHGETYLISSGIKQRNKPFYLSVSEVMTIVIAFHQSVDRDLKTYYIHFVCSYLTVKQGRQGLP